MDSCLSICNIDSCTGCGVCYNVCPHNAIQMVEDSEGFLRPQIDPSLCKNCGLCQKICPVNNPHYNNNENPECYAAAASDELRKNSSSGALFPVIAEYILDKGGYICGVAYISEDNSVEHIIVDNMEDLNRLKTSKYFQSNTKKCYKEIEKLLKDDKLVLFSGTPCQVAGLYAYLKKDYENLLTIDIVCHGVPSPMVYKKYISELPLDADEKVLNTNFRNKEIGWNPYLITTTTTKRILSKPVGEDLFMQAFLSDVCLRKSCHECRFAKIPRQGDITLGDFWGINKFNRMLNDNKGISLVLTNSEKGKKILSEVKSRLKIFKKAPLEIAQEYNPLLYKSNYKNTENRTLFFNLIKEKSLKEAVEICAQDKCDYLLVNLWWSCNYGAMLTAYALQQFIGEFGLVSKLLNSGETKRYQDYDSTIFGKFASEFLNISKVYGYKKAKKLSKHIKGIILGSDQVARPACIRRNPLNKYLLNFADKNTKKIALSASFGFDLANFKKDKGIKNVLAEMKKAYQGFDYLSCRELSGVEIFKDIFGLKADFILDPVFLVNKSAYDRILNSSDVAFDGIVSYVLDKNSKYDEVYNYISDKFKLPVQKIDAMKGDISVEDWLKYIKNCKFFITDSFHGVCFALLFNKPFVCLTNKSRGATRFDSLIETFGIKDGFVTSLDEIYNLDLNNNVNYDEFNKKLEEEVARCRSIIKDVLLNNYSNNEDAARYRDKSCRIKFNYLYLSHGFKFLLYSLLHCIVPKNKKLKAKMFQYKSNVSWF